MNDKLTCDDFKNIISKISDTIIENSVYLSKLDSKIGDGDHGTTIARGFRAVIEKIKKDPPDNISSLLKTTGFSLISAMGGASGPIFGSIFITMAEAAEGKESIGLKELTDMLSDALVKVKEIGKAIPGDKTLVDSLTPAVDSLKDSSAKGLSLKEALILAEESAFKGVESTKDMVAKKGRSKYLGERSLGHQDAGATSMFLIIKSINSSI